MSMDEERRRLQEDLRGLLTCEVRCDDTFLQLYATDASLYHLRPLGVIRPASTSDVVACMQYAAEHHLPIHARGAGSGLAGESLGPGLVLDFSRAMRKLMSLEGDRIRAQSGALLSRVNQELAPLGRQFGPDPANRSVCTLGGLVAIDGAGSRSLRYGSTRGYVESLQIVLSDATVHEVGLEPLSGFALDEKHARKRDLVLQIAELLRTNKELIESKRPRTRFNRCGYGIWDVLTETHLDLAKLLAGSEGTLALITEVTLRTVPSPGGRAVALLFFQRLELAARAVLEMQEFRPSACDLLDRRLLSLARDNDPRYDLLVPNSAEAALLVEVEGEDAAAAHEGLRQIIAHVRRTKSLAFDSRVAHDPEDMQLFWLIAREVVPNLSRLKGSTRPVPFVEDLAVPPQDLPGFLVKLQNIFKKHQVTASLYGHAGHGQLHVRPFLDVAEPGQLRTMQTLAAEIYREVFAVHGTISGEHGDGLSRTQFVHQQYGDLYRVLRELKRIFDPRNILNPGKIIGDDPFLLTRYLRPHSPKSLQIITPEEEDSSQSYLKLQLDWQPHEIMQAVKGCNGCGNCRTEQPGARMCPIFRFAPAEEASPRAKANLLRGVLTGTLPPEAVAEPEFKEVTDLCVNCKMCRLECPANVDIPKLVLEAKANHVAHHGLRSNDWFFTRLPEWSAFGSLISPIANWLISHPQPRWLLEKIFGLARGRKLPRFNARPFLQRAARRRLTRPTRRSGPKVAYFLDTYANYFDPQLAEALVAILEHNGIHVYVPPEQLTSGMPLIAMGAVDPARRIARQNLAWMAEAVRQGYEIVVSEPTAAVCITEEYVSLLDDPDARLVAQHTHEACTYLWQLHRAGRLRLDFHAVNRHLAYHEPCHLRALKVGTPGQNLLRLIPQLRLHTKEHGCSGMAGTFGLMKDHFASSLRAGWELMTSLRDPDLEAGVTECSACKMQMEQGTRKPTVHPLKLLAYAYGLLPGVEKLLSTPGEDLLVT